MTKSSGQVAALRKMNSLYQSRSLADKTHRGKGRLQRGELLGLDGRTRNATVDDDTVERMRDSLKGRFYVSATVWRSPRGGMS